MNFFRALEQIANGIYAGGRIRAMMKEYRKTSEAVEVAESQKAMLTEALEIIADYAPESKRSALSNSLSASRDYSETYRQLKHQFIGLRSSGLNKDTAIGTLKAARPVFNERSKAMIDKLLKIYDILNE